MNNFAKKLTDWIGSPSSIVTHTIFFIVIFALHIFNVSYNSILLILTTAVSLEAIYLAIFIQMTVNRNTQSLAGVEEDIDEIQEDIDEIEKDIDEIEKDEEREEQEGASTIKTLGNIEERLQRIVNEIETLKNAQK